MSLRRARWVNGTLVALALASSAAVVITSQGITTSERLARENNVFRSWRPSELRSIRVSRLDEERASPIVLTRLTESRDPHDFALGEKDPRKADPGAVSELLGALEFATWLRRIEPAEVERQSFGLQDPALEVDVTFRGLNYRLVVGGEAPRPKGARYAELTGAGVPDPGVGVIAAELVEQLRIDERAFLGRQLLPYAKSEVARIDLSGRGGERTLVRDARGWRVGGPEGPRAAAEVVDGMFFQMARVSAGRYVDVEAARRALGDEGSVTITQTPAEGEPVSVRIGGSCPGAADEAVALRETDPVVATCVPSTVLPSLATSTEELVDRSPFPFRPDEIDHVTLVEGDEVIEAVRTGARFDLIRPERREVELEAGNDFLQALVSPTGQLHREVAGPEAPTQREAPVDRKALGLSPPLGTATVRGLVEGNDEPVELSVSYGKPDAEGRVWLERKDDGALLALSRRRATAFSTDDTWTRSRTLLQLDEAAIERVSVRSGGTTRVVERAPEGGLRLVRPEGFELDGGLASDWLSALGDLRAARWLPPAIGPEHTPDALEVEVTYEEKGEPRRLRFFAGARTVGGHLATLADGSGARTPFVLPSATFRTLDTLPISRLTMTPDVDHLEQVTLEARGLKATLHRRGGELVSADGLLTPDSVTILEQALRGLQPVAAVHVGPARPSDGLEQPALVIAGRARALGKDPENFRYRFGRVGAWQGRTVQFARADGVDATFAFDQDQVQRLLDLL